MSDDFLTCEKCDFEWHRNDGFFCPICTKKPQPDKQPEYKGGLFGTGDKAGRMTLYYQAIGLLALVYMLYLIFGN